MNSKIIISSLSIVSLLFISCKKELEPQQSTPASELVALGLAKDTTKPNTTAVQSSPTNPNTVMNATGGINPAHGQPGHDCGVAVGAPLPSKATTNTVTVPNQNTQPIQTQQQVVTTTAAPAKVAKGMNPSHGQPGHRCDIAVGSPLNSAVSKPAAAASTQQGSTEQSFTVTPPANNPAVPALLSTESTNSGTTTTAPGTNPVHGQPGHRCDIAVGAALPKS